MRIYIYGLYRANTICRNTTLHKDNPQDAADVILGPGVGPYFMFLGLGFPFHPLKAQKGTLFQQQTTTVNITVALTLHLTNAAHKFNS